MTLKLCLLLILGINLAQNFKIFRKLKGKKANSSFKGIPSIPLNNKNKAQVQGIANKLKKCGKLLNWIKSSTDDLEFVRDAALFTETVFPNSFYNCENVDKDIESLSSDLKEYMSTEANRQLFQLRLLVLIGMSDVSLFSDAEEGGDFADIKGKDEDDNGITKAKENEKDDKIKVQRAATLTKIKDSIKDKKVNVRQYMYPVASILAHGGRWSIGVKELDPYKVLGFLSQGDITEKMGKDTSVERRWFATHDCEYNGGEITDLIEDKWSLGLSTDHRFVDSSFGGFGNFGAQNYEPDNNKLYANVHHGSIYIRATRGKNKNGCLLFGMEGSAPQTDDQFNQNHGASAVSHDIGVTGGPKFRDFQTQELKLMHKYGGIRSLITIQNLLDTRNAVSFILNCLIKKDFANGKTLFKELLSKTPTEFKTYFKNLKSDPQKANECPDKDLKDFQKELEDYNFSDEEMDEGGVKIANTGNNYTGGKGNNKEDRKKKVKFVKPHSTN